MIILRNKVKNSNYNDNDKINLNSIYDLIYLKNIGIYKFFVNEQIFDVIRNKLGLDSSTYNDVEKLLFNDTEYYCVYVGKTSSRFSNRIIENHLLGNKDSSTLRKSLESIFNKTTVDINDVYENKSFFLIIPKNNDKSLVNIESNEINEFYRPLNIKKNKKDEKNKNKYFDAGQELQKLRN